METNWETIKRVSGAIRACHETLLELVVFACEPDLVSDIEGKQAAKWCGEELLSLHKLNWLDAKGWGKVAHCFRGDRVATVCGHEFASYHEAVAELAESVVLDIVSSMLPHEPPRSEADLGFVEELLQDAAPMYDGAVDLWPALETESVPRESRDAEEERLPLSDEEPEELSPSELAERINRHHQEVQKSVPMVLAWAARPCNLQDLKHLILVHEQCFGWGFSEAGAPGTEIKLTPEGLGRVEPHLVIEFQRAQPTDGRELSAEELFIPTPLQKAIKKALDCRALKKEALAGECKVDPSRLYRKGALPEMIDLRIVEHKNGVGYFRPDAPPPDAVKVKRSPSSH